MKPAPFDYLAPATLAEALALLAERNARGDEAKLLAGGQSLIPVMNFRLAQPAVLIDLGRVRELDHLTPTPLGGLTIGAMARQRTVERDPTVARVAPLLAEAMPWIAHPQIRNRGTLGGSLAHADPAAELPAVATALDARLSLASVAGIRDVAAGRFSTGLFSTVLAPDEVLTEIALPPPPPRTGWAFVEVARRHGDYAQVGVAARLSLDADGRCDSARLVYFSVGDGPVDARGAAALLAGERPGPGVFAAAADRASRDEMDPAGDIHASAEFKRHLARVLTVRALTRAAARATEQVGGMPA